MLPMTIAIAGFVIGAASLNTGARYFAMVLMIAGGHGANAVVIAWVAKPMLRSRMKRAAAMSVNAGFAVGGILLVAFMRLALLRANKRLALLEAQEGDHESDGQAVDSQRVTETLTFRYVT
jgi:hypothetical protein